MKRSYCLILSILSLFSAPAMAQTDMGNLTVDAQLRARGEYRNGQGSLREDGVRPATFVNERARLGIGWELNNLSMKFSAQHVGVYGDTQQTNKAGDISVNEAWAKLKFGNDKFSAQLGRQVLSYDDERLLGGLDWAATGRSHDALRLTYEDGISSLHAVLAYNQKAENHLDNDYTGNPGGYKTMQTLWYHLNSHSWFQGSLLFMNIGVEGIGEDGKGHVTRCMQTFGTYLSAKQGAVSGNLAAYYQTGRNVSNQKVGAYMLSANVKYQINRQFAVGIGDDLLSGNDSDTKGDETHVFDVLYGTHHKFYGTMDYFNGAGLRKYGLNDLNANISFKPCDKFDVSATCHYFASPNIEVSDANADNAFKNKTLGTEVDLQFNWRIQKFVTLQGGYSVMGATKSLEMIQRSGNHNSWQDWGWLSININPRLFASKK